MKRSDQRYIAAVREARADPQSGYCFFSGRPIPEGAGDPAHILPVSTHPHLAYEVRNIVIAHRIAHNIYDQGIVSQVARLPRIHNILARMRQLDQHYYETFKNRIYAELSKVDGI